MNLKPLFCAVAIALTTSPSVATGLSCLDFPYNRASYVGARTVDLLDVLDRSRDEEWVEAFRGSGALSINIDKLDKYCAENPSVPLFLAFKELFDAD